MTVETYVAVAFDVKHKAAGVWPPIPNYGVIAVICPDSPQNITLFLGSQRSGLFERQRRMSLRHGLRVTTFAKVRNGSGADPRLRVGLRKSAYRTASSPVRMTWTPRFSSFAASTAAITHEN